MRVWLGEMFDTVLLLAGLSGSALCVWFLTSGFILEGGCMAFLSAVLLGAGTHLMKVAPAVRMVMEERQASRVAERESASRGRRW